MKTTVFLDLDGTLTDSRPGILAGAAHALTALGLPTAPSEVTTAFIGPPLYECFRGLYGLDDATSRRAVTLYREYYGTRGLFENTVYPGIPAMLASLREAGLTLCLATGKPHEYGRRIVSHFGLDRYISAVYGAEFDGTRGDKAALLSYALADRGLAPKEAVMVGDRRFDVEGALAVGVTPLGVLWGYGDAAELTAAGATHLAATPAKAAAAILSL
ncbi:MAG: HAD hydrolase-like protein [Clostridia bacterium]|nr:HAD hydrolase-like protein [Clostridia bacterium]